MTKTARIQKGFTLVELLVVIAIIAILAAVVGVALDPIELTRRGRDATRLSDLGSLQSAIAVLAQEKASVQDLYCDGVAPSPACTGGPFASNGETGSGTDLTNATAVDGSGWVRVDFTGQTVISITALPKDPTNTSGCSTPADDCLIYRYNGNASGYEIDTYLESNQYNTKMVNDGGDSNTVGGDILYEVGTVTGLTLL